MMAFAAILTVGMVSCGKEDNSSGSNSGNGVNNGGGNTGGGSITTSEWVDLGLQSGLLWASCNLGATKPEKYGNHYAWGETITKEVYDWDTYAYGNAPIKLTKYCNNAEYGLNGFTDNLTTLQAMDDAATAALGNGARTPTADEWRELINATTMEWTTLNGVNGLKLTSTANGNALFLPAAGGYWVDELGGAGFHGYYWSSSLLASTPSYAWYFKLKSDGQYMSNDGGRYIGFTVRAVRQK